MQPSRTDPQKKPVVHEDMAFQRRSWRVQKVGQLLVVAFVLAGLAGLFGGGGFARDEVAAAGSELRVEYPRFVRAHAPFDVVIHARPRADADNLSLWVDDALLEALRVERVSPQPKEEALADGKLVYRFALRAASPAPVRLRLEATKNGTAKGAIGIVGGAQVDLATFVHP